VGCSILVDAWLIYLCEGISFIPWDQVDVILYMVFYDHCNLSCSRCVYCAMLDDDKKMQ
jgi:hypothetical protein